MYVNAMNKDWLHELKDTMATLRAPGGCPWDREQTHTSLKRYLAEESAELFDAIDDGDDEGVKEELGDVLLQVVFHAQLAEEEQRFDLQDVARACCEKLVRRHPHVFADTNVADSAGVVQQWEEIKAEEKKDTAASDRKSALEGVPRHLPALHRAHEMQSKAAKVGFDWPALDGVLAKIDEELEEVKHALAAGDEQEIAGEIGDLLFAVVNLSRFRKQMAEELLHDTVRKFERRFRIVEDDLYQQNREARHCSLAELDALWDKAKASENERTGTE